MAMPEHTAFDTSHPAVAVCYFAGVLAITMCSAHPVVAAVSLVGALAFSALSRGARATLSGLVWQVPMLVLVCLANPLFSASGSTLLWRWGPLAVYAESLAYGACMGAVLVATIVWFEDMARVVTQERAMSLLGGVAPTVTLMISMVSRLVPQLMRRAAVVRTAADATCVADGDGRPSRSRTRLTSVLLTWSLEDSLVRADSMRARGWGASSRRTSYRRHDFRTSDGMALAGIVVLAGVSAFLVWVACSQWRFYPTMPTLVAWWGYIPFAAFVALPSVLALVERASWRFA